ncbi:MULTISPECIES: histidinol dehydrogenase [unclassified Cryobacterium]|uniref:histidinol dehydrogenase n=1 Tax=unclassified Cryobacterium TaxID=2649013 RepID=UPI002AB4B1E1|nr:MULTISPECIES: histidinol dehydrogenase [unclassified Cryobacterium]MDY7527561.1 histidinol dehydrogenase [Cryobacterium sp. 10C2]MDY7556656.1 histidinol dehydrogenase [Cryobacterium sp. 10C3]MEB0004124.1 histidinol dehydrogenase [Cryobacterium sp. RTC2.1]MEB0201950.1 histidinol dehydrogenase [Cryobacterium sp. 5I3]MEB0286898.1 histidinol dehydrogenase [Cryobacterium sp. 10S3]
MIQRLDLRGTRPTPAELLATIPRAVTDVTAASAVAAELISDVRARGEAALYDQAERLDRVRPDALRVPAGDIADALAGLSPEVRIAIEETIRRVRLASEAQVPPHVTTTIDEGAVITQRWQPIRRVGLYVPGGKAVYPSSVVMNVVPAQVAGVSSIALASPPQQAFGGRVHPTILAVAGLLGVTEIYAMGGAGAVGAFAYGVPSLGLDPVQLVTGPGNVYVAAAKRLVRGVTGIDAEAGPTDILVIADSGADPLLVAADLVSQAEHDELAAAVLVTDSVELADAVTARLAVLAVTTPHGERVTASLSGTQSAIVLVDDLAAAAAFSNAFGPEHLEIQTRDPHVELALIENAGAIFLGPNSPVSLGDYSAGSNHVLPTGGQARFSSGLGAYTFLRPQQVVEYSRDALRGVAANIAALSDAEDLPAHGAAVTARFA